MRRRMAIKLRDDVARWLRLHRATGRLIDWYSFRRSRLHVVSYPKCGRTWLRLGLGVALCEQFRIAVPDQSELLEINRLARIDSRIPSIRFSHDDNPHTKTASELQSSKRAYRSRDVVLLVRDPRDVVVSSFHQHRLRAPHFGDPVFEGSISEFVRHPSFGISTIVAFMNIWARNRDMPRNLLLVRYEDMKNDFERELRRVLCVAGVTQPESEALKRALQLSSFESMKALERADALGAERLRPTDPSNPDSFKVRKGRVGGYTDELDESDRDYVDLHMKELDPWFGYQV